MSIMADPSRLTIASKKDLRRFTVRATPCDREVISHRPPPSYPPRPVKHPTKHYEYVGSKPRITIRQYIILRALHQNAAVGRNLAARVRIFPPFRRVVCCCVGFAFMRDRRKWPANKRVKIVLALPFG